MSQHPFNIINQTASATRLDLNNALGALASLSSDTAAPTNTFANMLWYDPSTHWLWVRNESDTDWVRFAYFNQSTNKSAFVDDTQIVNTSGTQVGLLGDQTTATWQSGTGTTQSLVSPANVKAAVLALAPSSIPTTEQVAAATAGISFGAVGSYALLRSTAYTTATTGDSIAASILDYAHTSGSIATPAPSGTWRVMGMLGASGRTTLMLRIS